MATEKPIDLDAVRARYDAACGNPHTAEHGMPEGWCLECRDERGKQLVALAHDVPALVAHARFLERRRKSLRRLLKLARRLTAAHECNERCRCPSVLSAKRLTDRVDALLGGES